MDMKTPGKLDELKMEKSRASEGWIEMRKLRRKKSMINVDEIQG